MGPTTVRTDRLVPRYSRETDPNKMTDAEFAKLVALLRANGCLTAITVRRIDDRPGFWLVVDGHHRLWAAQVAGIEELPVVVEHTGKDVRALGLGLNHVRGREDLRVVAGELRDLTALLGTSDVALLTGYAQDEIADLLSAQPPEALLGAGDDPDGDGGPSAWVLEIPFADKATYQRARRLLMRASGGARDITQGLLAALGEKT